MSDPRHRAAALNAADAKMILRNSLPFVLGKITPGQIDRIQRIFSAAVLNPAVQKEYQDLYQKSIISRSGALVMRDPNIVRRADKVAEGIIVVSEDDKRIRLDLHPLLAHGALDPMTDNPDEAAYLVKVRHALVTKGVWLRVGQPFVRDPLNPSRHTIDPRKFEVWLSLGPDGDTIPTSDGQLTREAILGTTVLGAGYYMHVHGGSVQKAVEKQISLLRAQIDHGLEEHDRLINRHRDAFPGVAEISDRFGGAKLPPRTIWDHPAKLVSKALGMNLGGNFTGAQVYLVGAAFSVRNAAKLLVGYAEASAGGAGKAIAVLKVLKTAGEVAEKCLVMYDAAGFAVRGGMMIAAKVSAHKAAKKAARGSVDDLAEAVLGDYLKKNPEVAGDLGSVVLVPSPKGTIGGGIKPGTNSGNGTGRPGW